VRGDSKSLLETQLPLGSSSHSPHALVLGQFLRQPLVLLVDAAVANVIDATVASFINIPTRP
jgi:hypothetical protein